MVSDIVVAQRFNAMIDRRVPSFRRAIYSEKTRYINETLDQYLRDGTVHDLFLDKHTANMQRLYEIHMTTIMQVSRDFALHLLPELKSKTSLEVKRTVFDIFLMDWLTTYAAKKITGISQTTEQDIMRSIVSVNEEALETDTQVQRVVAMKARSKQISKFRADVIARTELAQAASYASKRNMEKLGAEAGVTLMKKWQPISDDRTRSDHASMAGTDYIPMGGKFDVGGEMLDRPSDPDGSAKNVVNCRCALLYKTDF